MYYRVIEAADWLSARCDGQRRHTEIDRMARKLYWKTSSDILF